jgi:hypothetical protein
MIRGSGKRLKGMVSVGGLPVRLEPIAYQGLKQPGPRAVGDALFQGVEEEEIDLRTEIHREGDRLFD